MNKHSFFEKWSDLHGGVEVRGAVKIWLIISYALVKPLALIKTSPHILTLLGVISGVGVWLQAKTLWAFPLLVLSLLCDGIDGSLAIVREITSDWGAVTDSVADRITEFFWALTFILLGAPIFVIAFAWLAAGVQEYIRARTSGLGEKKILVVSIAERPVRASLLFIALLVYHWQQDLVYLLGWAWLIMQLLSCVLILRSGYRRLSGTDRSSN